MLSVKIPNITPAENLMRGDGTKKYLGLVHQPDVEANPQAEIVIDPEELAALAGGQEFTTPGFVQIKARLCKICVDGVEKRVYIMMSQFF